MKLMEPVDFQLLRTLNRTSDLQINILHLDLILLLMDALDECN